MTALADDVVWPFRTDRLELRPAAPGDADATWAFRRLESVSRWLTTQPRSFEEHRSQFEEPASLEKTVIIERRGEVIGDLMIDVGDAWAQTEVVVDAQTVQADLGWVLHPDHVGRGFGTESVRAVLKICFEELGLRRVTADCFSANEASWRLMERVGMRREAHAVRESLHRSGEWLDVFGYALLADEWSDH